MRLSFKKATIILAAIAAFTQTMIPAFAAKQYYRTEVENNISLGDINIKLEEFERNERGELVPYVNNKLVVPGETVSKVATVTNLANDCWIRIHVDFEYEDGMQGLDDSMLILANDEWLYRGGYYYWTKPVLHGDTVNFLEAVHVPESWNEWYANKQFQIVISADAVQERNFTPLFDTDDPWFGTVIELCVHDEHLEDMQVGDAPFEVVFRGGAEGLVRIGDDFFSNWAEMMPGDTWEDQVLIDNKYERPVKIYFHSETIADEDDILVDKLILTIKNDDKVIYNGPLEGVADKTLLGEYKKGDSTDFTYSLYVPWELNNKYALTKTKTKWIFECELDDPENIITPTKVTASPNEGGSTKTASPVKTGVVTDLLLYIAMMTSACMLALAIYKKKEAQNA